MGIYVPWLADAARMTGYPVVEVNGWRTRGHGGMRVVEGVIGHHTATSRNAGGDYPSLNIVTNGHASLPGPLSAFGLGRSGTVYVIAAGTSWHAGVSAHAGFYDLNDEYLGIEAENDGIGEPWTAEQLDCYPRLVAAILHYMHRGADRYVSHREAARWPNGKIDPTGIETNWMRGLVAAMLANPASITRGGAPLPAPITPPPSAPATEFPLPGGHYFGDINGAAESHGGYYTREQVWVRQVQEALQRAGKAPNTPGWADGIWEQPTTDAMRAWESSAGRPVNGQCHRDDWDALVLGRGGAPAPAPSNGVPAFPLPRDHWFGDINGSARSHGGYYEHERGWIEQIQRALQRKGYAPGYAGWADGLFEQPTIDSVARWQRDHMPGTTFYGQVWHDDWAKLLG